MNTIHHPDPEFVGNLERELRATIRRQQRFRNGPVTGAVVFRDRRWTTVLVAVVAMCIGGAATFAVTNRLRARTAELIIARSQAQLEFAKARLDLFLEESQEVESRAAAGLLTPGEVDAMRLELAQVEANAEARACDLEETRLTGRDPDNSLSAPIVRGRDFVTERLELELVVLRERAALIDKQASAPGLDEEQASAIAREQLAAEAALSIVEQRLALREDFLSGSRTAREVELLDIRFSTERQREIAKQRVIEAQKQLDRMKALFEADLVTRSEVRAEEMEFRAAMLQRDLAELEMKILESKLADPADQ